MFNNNGDFDLKTTLCLDSVMAASVTLLESAVILSFYNECSSNNYLSYSEDKETMELLETRKGGVTAGHDVYVR